MNMNLVIGQGMGPAKFGMSEEEIIGLFGKADEREVEDYGDGKTLTLFYDNMLTDFTFDLDEDEDGNEVFKLSSLLCSNPDCTLDNKIHFGDSEDQVIKYTRSLKAADPQVEVDQETNERILYFDDLCMVAIFDHEGLAMLQIDYWDDADEEPED